MTDQQNQYEEINLADYVKVILKRIKSIILIIILALAGAFVFSILSPKIYKIDSVLEIGRIGINLIEAPAQLVEKINSQVYDGEHKIGIKADNLKNTSLINLKSESADSQKASNILEEVSNLIIAGHQEKVEIQRELIGKDINKIENKIELLDQEILTYQTKINLVSSNIETTKNKINPIKNDIQRIKDKIKYAQEEQKNLEDKINALEQVLIYEQSPGTQFALFDTKEKLANKKQEIENLYLTINSLERSIEDYNIQINDLESSKQDFNIKISSIMADKDDLGLEINQLNKSLQEIEPTKIVKQPTVSKSPIRPRPLLNTAIAGVLGLFIGVFLAFAREWWEKALS